MKSKNELDNDSEAFEEVEEVVEEIIDEAESTNPSQSQSMSIISAEEVIITIICRISLFICFIFKVLLL